MENKGRITLFSIVILIVCALMSGPLFADVLLKKDANPDLPSTEGVFRGTLVVTLPDGRITILEPGDAIPPIPSDSVIEVFDGHFMMNTEEGDCAVMSTLGFEFETCNGASATLIGGETDGKIVVHEGTVILKDEVGQEIPLNAPIEYPFAIGQIIKAPPAAAVDPTGFTAEGDLPPDSTGIDIPSPTPLGPNTTST